MRRGRKRGGGKRDRSPFDERGEENDKKKKGTSAQIFFNKKKKKKKESSPSARGKRGKGKLKKQEGKKRLRPILASCVDKRREPRQLHLKISGKENIDMRLSACQWEGKRGIFRRRKGRGEERLRALHSANRRGGGGKKKGTVVICARPRR